MSDEAEDDDRVSTGSSANEETLYEPNLQSRAYQLEMFDYSMKENIIAVLGTGTGKTQIARLRIEAELQRTPDKIIWFTTPNVYLAQQQHAFLSSQLPAFSFRLITSLDNADFWHTKEVWDAALDRRHGVVSTPQILLDALIHDFVSLESISLLVFDEAHHCLAKHPTNVLMQLFYHPLKIVRPHVCPSILGLTASAVQRDKLSLVEILETNLASRCRSPKLYEKEYNQFKHVPKLVRLAYNSSDSVLAHSRLLPYLNDIVSTYDLRADPAFQQYKDDDSLEGRQKFDKMREKQTTPVLKELRAFENQASAMQPTLGQYATDLYLSACAEKFDGLMAKQQEYSLATSNPEKQHLRALLQGLRQPQIQEPPSLGAISISGKVHALVRYLEQQVLQALSIIVIFVSRRSHCWALSQLLSRLPSLKRYRCFPLVGVSNPLRSSLCEMADLLAQRKAFTDFKAGRNNVCVATQVGEEGLDFQACDLVICWDPPANVKS